MDHGLITLRKDIGGKAPIRFVLSVTIAALGIAMSSPAFKANPLFDRIMGAAGDDMHAVLPKSLDQATEALKNIS